MGGLFTGGLSRGGLFCVPLLRIRACIYLDGYSSCHGLWTLQ